MRTLIKTENFERFYNALSVNVQRKIDYALNQLAEIKVVNTKLVKKLVNTDFYELRVKVADEYRIILFAIDHENLIEAEQVLLLNGFLKKSTKDYKREITLAETIINAYSDGQV